MIEGIHVRGGGGEAGSPHCLICRDDLRADVIVCAGCGARFHLECRAALARCSTLGCTGAPPARATPVAPPPPASPGVSLPIDAQAASALAALARTSLPQGSALPPRPVAPAPPPISIPTIAPIATPSSPGAVRVRRTLPSFVNPPDLVAVTVLCALATFVQRTGVGYRVLGSLDPVVGPWFSPAWFVVPVAWLAWRAGPGRRAWALLLLPVQWAAHQALWQGMHVIPALYSVDPWIAYLEPGLMACLVGGLLGLFGPPPTAEQVAVGGLAEGTVDFALRPGERLLWVGAPDPALAARWGALQGAGIMALIVGCGLVGLRSGALAVVCLTAPLALVLVAVVGAVTWLETARTLYGITTERAIAVRAGSSGVGDVRDIAAASTITDVWLRRGGDVLFTRSTYLRKGRQRTREDGFRHLPDPEPAARLLRDLAGKNAA